MRKPNILFVYADQLRYDSVGFNGNPLVRTPNMDRLAREGLVFDEAIASAPICGPYRGQLLTGQYAHVNGVVDNEYQLFPGQTTIAHALKREGYRTAYVGKWHLGHPPYPEAERHGFDDLIGYNLGHVNYGVESWHNEEGPFQTVDFSPYVDTQNAIDYMREHREESFCVVLAWGPPHWSWLDLERDYGKYPQEFDIYDPDKIELRGNVPMQFRDFARREMADYYGVTTALDACLKRLLDSLDELGLAEDTIVCFTSDHGDHLSSHGYGKPSDDWMHHSLQASKATPYEESVHVPFVVRYPAGIKGNRRSQAPFSSVDIMPTLLGLCGVPIPEGVQGTDLKHIALQQPAADSKPDPDSVYLQILGPGWPSRYKWVGLWRGVRTPRYTYARWKDRGGMRMLFDRDSDPLEMNNLAEAPEAQGLVEKMESLLQEWIRRTGDPFDDGERLPDTEMLDLGQRFTLDEYYDLAPAEYAAAIRKYGS